MTSSALLWDPMVYTDPTAHTNLTHATEILRRLEHTPPARGSYTCLLHTLVPAPGGPLWSATAQCGLPPNSGPPVRHTPDSRPGAQMREAPGIPSAPDRQSNPPSRLTTELLPATA